MHILLSLRISHVSGGHRTKICGPAKIDCMGSAYKKLFQGRDFEKCNCLPACTSIVYNAYISQADYDVTRTFTKSVFQPYFEFEKWECIICWVFDSILCALSYCNCHFFRFYPILAQHLVGWRSPLRKKLLFHRNAPNFKISSISLLTLVHCLAFSRALLFWASSN